MTASIPTLYPVIVPVPASHRQLMGRERVRFLSRLARLALDRSCRISGLPLHRLPKGDNGAPLPVDGVYWSLSHKRDVVGAVAAPVAVGVDLETIRPVHPLLFDKVADEGEWELTAGDRLRTFFRLWTAKEAVLKAVGRGIAGLSRCRIADIVDESRMILTYDKMRWTVVHHWFDDHVAALTPHHFHVSWRHTTIFLPP